MAKPKPSHRAEPTRKETARRRRDEERNRRVLIGLAAVAGLLILIIAAGVVQELVLKPRQPIAVVNDARISTADYARRVRYAWYQESLQQQGQDPQTISLNVLDQMIDEQLLRQEAQKRGITVSADEIERALEESFGYRRYTPTPSPTPSVSPTPEPTPTPGGSPTPTPLPTATPVTLESYQSQLKDYLSRIKAAADLSEADLRALVELDLLREKLYEAVTKDVPTTAEQVHARHILVKIIEPAPTPTPLPEGQPTPTPDPSATPTPAPRDDAQALARILEVQQKLAAGEDFAELARQYSDDTFSAQEGGDLGWFGRGQMVAEFEETAFSLEPGKISEPVKTSYGYHIIQVLEKDPARPLDPFTLEQNRYIAFQQWLSNLRNTAKIERNWTLDKVPPTPGAR
ncbi:MAG: peptidylprolyl isomerase [Anaerolineae bacterium]